MAVNDVLFLVAAAFVLGIGFFFLNFLFEEVTDRLIESPLNESSDAVSAFSTLSASMNRLDYGVFAVFMGMILVIMVTGWFLGGEPLFMFIYLLIFGVGTLISFILSNIWEYVSTLDTFGVTLVGFPLTNHLLLNLPLYAIAAGLLGFIVMFAKPYLGRAT